MSLTMSVTYSDFPTLTPSKGDKAIGGVALNGSLYCKPCMRRLKIDWDDVKYITKTRGDVFIYNCISCGKHITAKRAKDHV